MMEGTSPHPITLELVEHEGEGDLELFFSHGVMCDAVLIVQDAVAVWS